MANVADEIPGEFLHADAKYRVIQLIHDLGLPGRFRRKLLQDWATQTGATLTPDDYDAVTKQREPGRGT